MTPQNIIQISTFIEVKGHVNDTLLNHLSLHSKREFTDLANANEFFPNYSIPTDTYKNTLVSVSASFSQQKQNVLASPEPASNLSFGTAYGARVWYSDSIDKLEGLNMALSDGHITNYHSKGIHHSDDLRHKFMLIILDSTLKTGERANINC